jgi:hypothetical protein
VGEVRLRVVLGGLWHGVGAQLGDDLGRIRAKDSAARLGLVGDSAVWRGEE